MAAGVIIPGIDFPASPVERPYPSPAALTAVNPVAGDLTSHQPISIRSLDLAGVRQTSFADDWFNRLHLIPRVVDYGAVGSDATRVLTLWNAYLSNTSLTTVTVTNSAGMQVSAPTLPVTLRPLEYTRHNAVARQDGPAAIDSTVTFVTNRGSITARLIGTRAHLWPFAPNWRESVTVEQEYRTDVLTSRSGREQRRALRDTPRKTVEYRLTADRSRLHKFQRAMAKWQNRPVVMGDPTRFVSTPVFDGASVTLCDVPPWITAGANLVIDDREMVTVDTVDAGTVTFLAPPQQPGLTLRPALQGLLSESIGGKYATDTVAEFSISFNVTPGSEAATVAGPGYDLLNGREVFGRRFNWASGLDVTHAWPTETVDFGWGRTSTFRPIGFGTETRKAVFVQQGADDMAALEDFFQRQMGQRGEFYMPSGTDDIPLLETVAEGTSNLVTGGTEVFDAYDGDTVHAAVQILLRDGRRLFRRVTGMFVEDGNTVLQCDRDFLTDISPAEVVRISWLTCSRFASDQFQQEWLTSEVAQTSLAVKSLEDLPTENPIPDLDGGAQWFLEVWGDQWLGLLDRLDEVVNVEYAAVWHIPEGWVTWNSTQAALCGLDYIVNVRYPQIWGNAIAPRVCCDCEC